MAGRTFQAVDVRAAFFSIESNGLVGAASVAIYRHLSSFPSRSPGDGAAKGVFGGGPSRGSGVGQGSELG